MHSEKEINKNQSNMVVVTCPKFCINEDRTIESAKINIQIANHSNEPIESLIHNYRCISFKDGISQSNYNETNSISTTHYSLLTFIPKCLFEQCTRPANFYFICVAVLQCLPPISMSEGIPTMGLPLSFVLGVTLLKYAIEDYRRYKDDRKQNQKLYSKLRIPTEINNPEDSCNLDPGHGVIEIVKNEEIKVGDVIIVHDGDEMPADLLFLGRYEKEEDVPPKMFCHVETANIDGETSLKVKHVVKGLNHMQKEIAYNLNTEIRRHSVMLRKKKISHNSGEKNASIIRKSSAKPVTNSIVNLRRSTETIFLNHDMDVFIPEPNGNLDKFENAVIHVTKRETGETKKCHVEFENFLHRGCSLANSGYIYGLVLYAGLDCKIFKNGKDASQKGLKPGEIEKVLHSIVFVMGCFMICVCISLSIANGLWMQNTGKESWYLNQESGHAAIMTQATLRFFTFIIMFCNYIPISMLVSLEMMRLSQSLFMFIDPNMQRTVVVNNSERVVHCKCQQSSLNEDLGRVEFIFTDKTGTLTENELVFRQAFIPGVGVIGGGFTQIAWMNMLKRGELDKLDNDIRTIMTESRVDKAMAEKLYQLSNENVREAINVANSSWIEAEHVLISQDAQELLLANVYQSREGAFLEHCTSMDATEYSYEKHLDYNLNPELGVFYTEMYLRSLALNSDVFPVVDELIEGKIEYNASTPDDVCFACFTKVAGIELRPYSKPHKILQTNLNGTVINSAYSNKFDTETWDELHILPFSSAKARMSCVYQPVYHNTQDFGFEEKVVVFVKGSDKIIGELCTQDCKANYKQDFEGVIATMAEEGLRTLVTGFAIRSRAWWDKWEPELKRKKSPEEQFLLEEQFDREAGYVVCGITAVEDRLQKKVPETVEALLRAGIRVWMLTGDKRETAINIGIACNLLSVDKSKRIVMTRDNALQVLTDFRDGYIKGTELVLEGQALSCIFEEIDRLYFENPEEEPEINYLTLFTELALTCNSVVSCRLMPNQKATIVNAIKQKTGLITLSIGDGANDVPMIKTAGVGVGIQGLEGTAAARNADYVIGRFSYLRRLLFIHGRQSYRGTTYMLLYLLWKNCVYCSFAAFFAFFCGYSGVHPLNDIVHQVYNTFPTGWPIFAFVLFDYDILPTFLETIPQIYSISNGNRHAKRDLESLEVVRAKRARKISFDGGCRFNLRRVLIMISQSMISSLILIFVMQYPFHGSGFTTTGHNWGLMINGTISYLSLVYIPHVMLCYAFTRWTWKHWFLMVVGPISVILIYMTLDASSTFALSGINWYGLITYCRGEPFWWYHLVLAALAPMLPTHMWYITEHLFFPTELTTYQIQTIEAMKKKPMLARCC